MKYEVVKEQLLAAVGYDLEITGSFGQSKTITLTMADGSPDMLQFRTLGSGSMKRVVEVVGTGWVLALAGDSPGAVKDITGEVDTLLRIGADGVRVPEPFTTGKRDDILFELTVYNSDIGDEKTYPVFLQQYLSGKEMEKLKKREDFAKDFILSNSQAQATIETTIDDIENILAALKKKEWGDFQVIYMRDTGYVFVFDPLPENTSGTSSIPVVEAWLSDLSAAKSPVVSGVTA
jgi:hypothetical protein